MLPESMMEESNEEKKTPDIPSSCQPQIPLSELLCSEVCDHELIESGARSLEHCDEILAISYFDPAVLHHPEVMSRLKFLESQIDTPKGYFHSDSEIAPYMRKVLADWMFQVCEESDCEDTVFPLAISILDQFLSDCLIKKEQFQLVGCVCLLLASKARQVKHFTLELLCWYTDQSVSPQTLRTWEQAILSQLNWDVNFITAMDFVDLLLARSVCEPYKLNEQGNSIRKHANTFISLCYTEPKFVGLRPSVLAAASILIAVKGLSRLVDTGLVSLLAEMTTVPEDKLRGITRSIQQAITSALEQQGLDGPLPSYDYSSSSPVQSTTQISKEVFV